MIGLPASTLAATLETLPEGPSQRGHVLGYQFACHGTANDIIEAVVAATGLQPHGLGANGTHRFFGCLVAVSCVPRDAGVIDWDHAMANIGNEVDGIVDIRIAAADATMELPQGLRHDLVLAREQAHATIREIARLCGDTVPELQDWPDTLEPKRSRRSRR